MQPPTITPSQTSPMDLLLKQHNHATTLLYTEPHNPHRHTARGSLHERLGYYDLAAADAYRALTLWESVVDPEGCEFHARRRRRRRTSSFEGDIHDLEERETEDEEGGEAWDDFSVEEYYQNVMSVYAMLVRSLLWCGCFRDAYEFCIRGLELFSGTPQAAVHDGGGGAHVRDLQEQLKTIKMEYVRQQQQTTASDSSSGVGIDSVEVNPSALNAQGYARRVLYPWNTHEPDRKAPETLRLLNDRLRDVAPKCEVRAVALPALHAQTDHPEEVSVQLGLFAKEAIAPGEVLLRESSLLTATNRLHDDLCDACHSPLPELSADDPPVPCEECADTIFCSQKCHDLAQTVYHRAVCGLDGLESIGKDIPDPKDRADYLYLLLLGRAIAMAATQEMHPLDLPEVKYIWGDFHEPEPEPESESEPGERTPDATASLPFSFQLNILQPLRILEEMELDPFATLPFYDTWVLNTLYAKFRGTASGRLSTWDGGPEVCAVHPLWCLANHSCDPNVRWEWGGEIAFVARTRAERAVWKKPREKQEKEGNAVDEEDGIRKDREILNHYCDIGLGVKDRREWAYGALGGFCQCERCVWEASLEEERQHV